MYIATQSTQTLEEDEDDDQYATPLALPLLSPGQQLDLSSLHQRHPLLNPELFRKLQKVARRRSSSQSQRQAIAALLALYLEQVSPASSPVESEREEGEQRKSTASPADPERYVWQKRESVCVCVCVWMLLYSGYIESCVVLCQTMHD